MVSKNSNNSWSATLRMRKKPQITWKNSAKKFPRYKRDQLAIIHDYGAQLDQSLEKCTQEKLYSANDFRDVARHLSANTSQIAESRVPSIRKPVSDIQVSTRPLSTYVSILKGDV